MQIRSPNGIMWTCAEKSELYYLVDRHCAERMIEKMIDPAVFFRYYHSFEIDDNPDLSAVKDFIYPAINPQNPWVKLTISIVPSYYNQVIKKIHKRLEVKSRQGNVFFINRN